MAFVSAWVVALGACSDPLDPSTTGASAGAESVAPPLSVIEARRALMADLQERMLPIDGLIGGSPAEAAELTASARAIEALLHAMPPLFPPTTNLYDASLPDPPTLALPTIWQSPAAFAAETSDAQAAAATLAAARDDASLRAAGVAMRAACDACHATFMKPYAPSQASSEDLEFDFESVLPPQ
jgi:cytochrome c556